VLAAGAAWQPVAPRRNRRFTVTLQRRVALQLDFLGDAAGAEGAYKALALANPKDADARRSWATLLEAKGDWAGAETLLKAARAIEAEASAARGFGEDSRCGRRGGGSGGGSAFRDGERLAELRRRRKAGSKRAQGAHRGGVGSRRKQQSQPQQHQPGRHCSESQQPETPKKPKPKHQRTPAELDPGELM
jgi:hypothetical protein